MDRLTAALTIRGQACTIRSQQFAGGHKGPRNTRSSAAARRRRRRPGRWKRKPCTLGLKPARRPRPGDRRLTCRGKEGATMPRSVLAIILALGALLALPGAGPRADSSALAQPEGAQVAPLSPPVTVKVGVQGSAANAPIYIGYERGYFRDEGLNLELVLLPSANELLPALATGQIDVASGGIAASLFNAFARGIDLRVVADSVSTPPGPRGSAWVARQDLIDSGALRTPADLRGRTVAMG